MVLVDHFIRFAFEWYGTGVPVRGLSYLDHAQPCPLPDVAPLLTGATRVWYLSSLAGPPVDIGDVVMSTLSSHGTVVDSRAWDATGEGLAPPGWILVDLSVGPDPHPRPVPTDASTFCLHIFT